jgi:hypothetical protein
VSNAPAPITPPSPDAKLSSLDVNPGPLQPVFSSDTLGYTVDVAFNVASVTVTATPQNASATMTINGVATNAGQALPITLQPAGFNTIITIVVTAANGGQNSYVVTVNRALNNSLQNLIVSPGTLSPAFTASATSYTVDVDSGVNSVTVTATLQDTNATMTINGQTTTSGQARTITPLNGPGLGTLITIVVTAPNGSQKIYFATVNRAALGGNNNLQSLTVSSGSLTPAFAAGTTSYTVDVASGVTSVTVTAQAQDVGASVSIDGQATTSRSVTLNGAGFSTPIAIVVTAPNSTTKTYTVLVNRAALGGNNNLQSLTVSSGTLTPVFAADTTSYTVDVASGVGSLTVTAAAQDAGASVTINGSPTTSLLVTLNAPGLGTLITIAVTAPNGSQRIYFATVNRAALGGNNNLQSLTVSSSPAAGALTPAFVAPGVSGSPGYTVDVASSVNSVTVTAQAQDAGATVSINNQAGTSRSVTLNGPGTGTLVTIVVSAPNGNPKTYLVTVNQAALASNAGLSNLAVNTGTLTPGFAAPGVSGLPGYTVAVPNATTSITVTAVQADPSATLTISPSATVNNLPVGNTVFTIEVTAPNGNQKIYFVTVTRAAPGGNNNLSALVVSAGALVPFPFAAATTSYTVAVSNTTLSTTVTATVEDSTATLKINNAAATSGIAAGPIALAVGPNSIPIEVTAQNLTTKTYTVTVNRAAPSPAAPDITTTSADLLPNGLVNGIVAYSRPLTATGGSGALTWSIASGTLPTGLTLSPTTGIISGTPSVAGTFIFTPQATDTLLQTDLTPPLLSITIDP